MKGENGKQIQKFDPVGQEDNIDICAIGIEIEKLKKGEKTKVTSHKIVQAPLSTDLEEGVVIPAYTVKSKDKESR